jgi:hypothetical protein
MAAEQIEERKTDTVLQVQDVVIDINTLIRGQEGEEDGQDPS